MLRELARACEDASWDDEIRVVVVTGAGRAFCVGADLKSWSADYLGKPQEYWKWFGAFKDAHDRMREIGKPTLARVNGIAVGGGNELQMACDLAVMVDDAFIRHVGLEHGSVPAGGATQWLPVFVGDRRDRARSAGSDRRCRRSPERDLARLDLPAERRDGRGRRPPGELARRLRNGWGSRLEDGPYGAPIRIEDSSRVNPWIVRQVERERAACRERLAEFSRLDRTSGEG